MFLATLMKPAFAGVVLLLPVCACALEISISANRDEIPMGRTVQVDAVLTHNGQSVVDRLVLPYVNGNRWGAHERTDSGGRARFLLPLPNVGKAVIRVRALESVENAWGRDVRRRAVPWGRDVRRRAVPCWVWEPNAQENQTITVEKVFELVAKPTDADLRLAVDDSCEVFLNGDSIGEAAGWDREHLFAGLARHLREGENVLRLVAHNGTGPCGVVARLTIHTESGKRVVTTDGSWTYRAETGSAPVRVLGSVDKVPPWANAMGHWPGCVSRRDLLAGSPLPENARLSNAVTVQVRERKIEVYEDPEHLIGMQWEPWFTPMNAFWQTAQAVPVVGFYDSFNRDVMLQHALWLMDAGVNFIYVDWSNHIWGKKHWNERPPNANEIIDATTATLEAYADMRDEGLPVPKVVIMPGLSNGPPTTMEALNEELQWIYDNYVCNERFAGLWVEYEGKPLIVPLDCAHIAMKDETPPVGEGRSQTSRPVDDTHFTVRWMGTQLQASKAEKFGYWSWMDGCLEPIVTYHDGAAEVVTPTPAYFGHGGWLYPEARGRRGGTTFLESFKSAMRSRPRFVLFHQWNEFAGQPEGHGYGEKKDIYVDSYSVELSDDLEPVSLTAHAYRGEGGWGYYYYNLTHALIDLFHHGTARLRTSLTHGTARLRTSLRQEPPEDTILAVHPPGRGQVVTDSHLDIEWAAIGKEPDSYTVLLDDTVVAERLSETAHRLDLRQAPNGKHTVGVVAEGTQTRFLLSCVEEDVRLADPVPVKVEIPFVLRR